MVCFTSHLFKFTNANKYNWFHLLCKYYEGVGVTVVVDGTQKCKGGISLEFFNNVVPVGTNYECTTDKFWAEKGSINCMPKYVAPNNQNDIVYSSEIINASSNIDSVVSSRLSHGGQEVFMSRDITISNFNDLLTAFSLIKNTEHITRSYVSHKSEAIVIVLNDRHTLLITKDSVNDSTLPVFDVDDGFLPNAFDMGVFMDEFNVAYKVWHDEFVNTGGDNWHTSILE